MANQLYSFNYSNYGTGGAPSTLSSSTSKYFSRSVTEPYISSVLGSSRYLSSSEPLSSSSMLFNYTDSYASASNVIPALPTATATASASASASATASATASTQPLQLASYLSWPGPPGVDVGAGSASAAISFYAGMKRPATDAIYHPTITSTYNMIGQNEALFSINPLVKHPRVELPQYPQRPGEKDCAHYMLTRTCMYGDSCKFDHPIWVPEGGIPDWKEVPLPTTLESLPERPGEPDCPYFVKTQRCKYGSRCKFNHPKAGALLVTLENVDVASLPERPYEPPCAFYMKTGKCKFGMTCKFHHPKDLQVPPAGQEISRMESTSLYGSETAGNLMTTKPLLTPALLHNSKGLPVRQDEVDCPFYLKTGSCKFGATCRYNHPERNMIYPTVTAIGTSTAHPLNFSAVPASSIMQTFDPRILQTTLQFDIAPAIYPQRPGELECDFYMKTGDCKFGQRCRFHHPIDRLVPSLTVMDDQQENVKLSLAGLPRREGAIHCPYYMKTGTCKYGVTCKFDHPAPAEVMATTEGQGKNDDVKTEAETGK